MDFCYSWLPATVVRVSEFKDIREFSSNYYLFKYSCWKNAFQRVACDMNNTSCCLGAVNGLQPHCLFCLAQSTGKWRPGFVGWQLQLLREGVSPRSSSCRSLNPSSTSFSIPTSMSFQDLSPRFLSQLCPFSVWSRFGGRSRIVLAIIHRVAKPHLAKEITSLSQSWIFVGYSLSFCF